MFTVAYVSRFNELEAAERAELESRALMPAPRLGEYNACARIVIRTLRELGTMPEDVILFLQGLYRPLGINIDVVAVTEMDALNDPAQREPQYYTAKQIAELLGIYSINGNPHAQAVSCIINENLFISEDNKTIVTFDCGDHIGISVRYDEYAFKAVKDWIIDWSFPEEVYGFERTYRVRYDH
jgi:hypothetical protein